MTPDFTLAKYVQLCETIKRLSCPVMTVRQFLAAKQPRDFGVVLRHDVDRALPSAIRLAELEATYGFQATYYLRMTRPVFKPEQISRLHRLGHEVGYHYEVLTRARGNKQRALEIFTQELAQFRQVVPVDTISMHGSPLQPWNNLAMWQTYDFKQHNLMGEAYLSVDYSHVYYFTDTGRNWTAGRYNIRDRVAGRQPAQKIRSTDELISFLTQTLDSPVFINAHPNRWSVGWSAWVLSYASDWAINQIKWIISLTR